MKQYVAFLLTLAMVLGALVGCEGSVGEAILPDSEAPKAQTIQEKQTLEVVTSYGGDDGNRSNFERAVESFEKSTGCIVHDDSANSNEKWKAKVLTDFDTGSEPDVLFFFTKDAQPLIAGGKVVSIEEIRDVYPDYATNMKQSMLAQAEDGQHYAVPSYGYWENLFVNKAVLDACNVDIPGPDYTWDQFFLDCQTIKDRGYTPIACSLFEVPNYWFEFAVMNNGTVKNHMQVPQVDSEGNLIMNATAEKWVAALNDISTLYRMGFFPKNTLTATDAQTVTMFGEGKAAFLIDGSWRVGYFSENFGENLEDLAVRFVPGKGKRVATETLSGISMGYFITRKAWNDPAKRELAVKFVSHMTTEEVLSQFVTTEVTALVNGAKPQGLNILQLSAAEANVDITGAASAVQDTITREAKKELFSNISRVVTGQMTAEEAVASAMRLN